MEICKISDGYNWFHASHKMACHNSLWKQHREQPWSTWEVLIALCCPAGGTINMSLSIMCLVKTGWKSSDEKLREVFLIIFSFLFYCLLSRGHKSGKTPARTVWWAIYQLAGKKVVEQFEFCDGYHLQVRLSLWGFCLLFHTGIALAIILVL